MSAPAREIRLNAFDMACVGHIQQGMRTQPRDRATDYLSLQHWTGLARTLERGLFDGLFLADVLGVYDVHGGSQDAAVRGGVQAGVAQGLFCCRPHRRLQRAGQQAKAQCQRQACGAALHWRCSWLGLGAHPAAGCPHGAARTDPPGTVRPRLRQCRQAVAMARILAPGPGAPARVRETRCHSCTGRWLNSTAL